MIKIKRVYKLIHLIIRWLVTLICAFSMIFGQGLYCYAGENTEETEVGAGETMTEETVEETESQVEPTVEETESQVEPPEEAEGVYGAYFWSYRAQVLTVEGTGVMDAADGNFPWSIYKGLAKKIVLKGQQMQIADYAFDGFSEVHIVSLGNVSWLGAYAFRDCTSLRIVFLPLSLMHIERTAFENCYCIFWFHPGNRHAKDFVDESGQSSAELEEPKDSGVYKGEDGNYYEVLDAEHGLVALASYTGEDKVHVVVGGMVRLEMGYPKNDEIMSMALDDNDIAVDVGAMTERYYSCYYIKNSAFDGLKQQIQTVTIRNTVKLLDSETFKDCINMNSVFFGEGSQLNSLPNRLFYGCANLQNFDKAQNNRIKVIEGDVFYGCDRLARPVFPFLEYEDTNAFRGMGKLYEKKKNSITLTSAQTIYSSDTARTVAVSASALGGASVTFTGVWSDGKAGVSLKNGQLYLPAGYVGTIRLTAVAAETSAYLRTGNYLYMNVKCAAVTNLRAGCETGGVMLRWSPSKQAEGYLIYGIRNGGKYGYIGMTGGTSFKDTKASKTEWSYYWVYPYRYVGNHEMEIGGTPKYVYGRSK